MFLNVFLLSLSCAFVAFTITESALFEKFRDYMDTKGWFLSSLFSCGYCLGVYIALFLELIFRYDLFDLQFIGHVLTWFVISWLSGIQYYIVCYLCKVNCD